MKIGKLDNVPVRNVWKNEPADFNKWLADNIAILSEALNMPAPIVTPDTEIPVGTFSADLVMELESGEKVVIECQLEDSDHKHLGQVITYLTNLEAKIAIWICTRPRPEHIRAISWLNEYSPADILFYLVQLQTVAIGESPPAPLFTVISGPSEEVKATGRAKELDAERHKLRFAFWTELLDKEKTTGGIFKGISPSKYVYIQKAAGSRGITYRFVVTYNYAAVELYIDTDEQDLNKNILDSLKGTSDEIEGKFGGPLEWEFEKGRRACKVKWKKDSVSLKDEDAWPALQDEMVDVMSRFHGAIDGDLQKTMKKVG